MKKETFKIQKRLLGRIEKRGDQYVFVPKVKSPKVKVEYVPYWTQMA